jgi:nucleoside-diphosphate-sugar epimerase
MKVFVLGGTGLVGSAFVRHCAAHGIACESITRANRAEYEGRICDVLVDAHGNSRKFLADRDPRADFDATVRSVGDALHAFKYGAYVLCSSCDVYNDFADSAATREDAAIDPVRQSRYGFHKRLAEQLVQYEARRHLILRFGGFVGPGLKKNPIYDILHGGPLWLHSESRLQYMHTDAAAKIVFGLLDAGKIGEVFNVCGNGLVRLQDVIERVKGPVAFKENSPRVTYEINIDKIKTHSIVPSSGDAVFAFVDQFNAQSPRVRVTA